MKYFICEAESELAMARRRCAHETVDLMVGAVRLILEQNGASLESIGTSEGELECLVKSGHLAVAKRKIERIKIKPKSRLATMWLKHIEEDLELAGLHIDARMAIVSNLFILIYAANNCDVPSLQIIDQQTQTSSPSAQATNRE